MGVLPARSMGNSPHCGACSSPKPSQLPARSPSLGLRPTETGRSHWLKESSSKPVSHLQLTQALPSAGQPRKVGINPQAWGETRPWRSHHRCKGKLPKGRKGSAENASIAAPPQTTTDQTPEACQGKITFRTILETGHHESCSKEPIPRPCPTCMPSKPWPEPSLLPGRH